MTLGCKSPDDVMRAIKDHGDEMVDVRFTDVPGGWQHTSYPATMFEADALHLTFVNGTIITNPPWARSILHPMITHFSAQRVGRIVEFKPGKGEHPCALARPISAAKRAVPTAPNARGQPPYRGPASSFVSSTSSRAT